MFGNNDSNGRYLEACKRLGYKPHPARFPIQLPTFFIRFLTDPEDLVLDPFAGSNTTGEAAEREGRNWIAIEPRLEYLEASQSRFEQNDIEQIVLFPPREKVPSSSANEDTLFSPTE
jgi:site-specific DNA-methyltransferase (cytosine-N4-specific)